jgi:hypothetical protein
MRRRNNPTRLFAVGIATTANQTAQPRASVMTIRFPALLLFTVCCLLFTIPAAYNFNTPFSTTGFPSRVTVLPGK